MQSSTQKTTSELSFSEKELTDYHGMQVFPMRAIKRFSRTFCLPCDILRSLTADDVSQYLQQVLPEQEAPAIASILRNFAEMLIIRYKAKPEEYNDLTVSQVSDKQRLIAENGEAAVTDLFSLLEVSTGKQWHALPSLIWKKISSLLLSQTLPHLTAAEVKQEMYEPMLHRLFGAWCTQTKTSEADEFEAVHKWSMTKQDGAVVAVDIPTCIARYTPKSFLSYQHPHLFSELQRAFHALLECHKKLSVLGVSAQTLSELKCLVVFGSPDRVHIATVRLEQNGIDGEMYPIIALTSCYFDAESAVVWFLHEILRLMLQQRREIAKITAVCSNQQQLETSVSIQAAWERSALIPRLAVCDQFGTTPNPPFVSQVRAEEQTTVAQLNTAVQCFTSKVQALELLKAKGINLNLRSTAEISVKNGDYTEDIIKLLRKLLHLDAKLGIIAFQELQKTILRQSKVVSKENLQALRKMYLVAYEEMIPVTQLQSSVEQLHFIKNILTAAASIHSAGLVHGNINSQAMTRSKVKDEYYLSISHARFVLAASLFDSKSSLYTEYQAPENLESSAMDSWSIGMAFGSILLGTKIKKEFSSFQNKALLLLSLQEARATGRISESICDLIENLVEEDSNKRLSCRDALYHTCFTE